MAPLSLHAVHGRPKRDGKQLAQAESANVRIDEAIESLLESLGDADPKRFRPRQSRGASRGGIWKLSSRSGAHSGSARPG